MSVPKERSICQPSMNTDVFVASVWDTVVFVIAPRITGRRLDAHHCYHNALTTVDYICTM